MKTTERKTRSSGGRRADKELAGVLKAVRSGEISQAAIADEMTRATKETYHPQEVFHWLHADPQKRTEPKLGIGMLIIDAVNRLMAEEQAEEQAKRSDLNEQTEALKQARSLAKAIAASSTRVARRTPAERYALVQSALKRVAKGAALLALILLPSLAHAGTASWYGEEYRGRTMANGKPFVPEALTAASWHHPLGTKLRVTHGRRSVVVTVTDRGPDKRLDREIDLSNGAFRLLAAPSVGLIPVTVRPVKSGE